MHELSVHSVLRLSSEEPSNIDVAYQTMPKFNVDGTEGREAEVVR